MESAPKPDHVSRARYEREKAARKTAEALLEEKSRELYLANRQLNEYSQDLEEAVLTRTAEMRDALNKAEAASATRSRFLATMSHEIRTPLGGLLGMIDLLRGEETDPEKLELLTHAQASGEALKRIVNDVLVLSKMESGAFHFENERVDIRALIEGVIALSAPVASADGITVASNISHYVPHAFSGDGTRIRQVIANLVSNAISYSERGMIEVRATAKPRDDGVMIRVEVEDQGVGISAEQQEMLFKDFSQIPNKLTAAAQGTGLGLAISKRIVEGLGGSIGVQSNLGLGSIFWFEIPVVVLEQGSRQPGGTIPAAGKAHRDSLEGVRILVAEDNRINQKLIITYLKRMGIVHTLAQNGLEAVSRFRPDEFDLLLMDVAMPEMDGLEAIKRIREIWKPHEIPPIALLTAHVMDAIKDEGASVGVDCVLNKPIAFNDLRESLLALLPECPGTGEGADPSFAGDVAGNAGHEALSFFPEDVLSVLQASMEETEILGLLRDFTVDTRKMVSQLRGYHEQGDYQAVARVAHNLKGSAALLGFLDTSMSCAQIETGMAELSEDDFRNLLGTILEDVDRVEAAL